MEIEDGNAGFISITYLRDRIADIVEGRHPDTVVLVIDSVNEWLNTAKTKFPDLTDKERLDNLKVSLIDLSKEFNVTIFLSAQEKGNGKAIIDDLEFAANTHFNFSWEKDGRQDRNGIKYLNIESRKNRSGASRKNKIQKFKGSVQEFVQ